MYPVEHQLAMNSKVTAPGVKPACRQSTNSPDSGDRIDYIETKRWNSSHFDIFILWESALIYIVYF